MKLFFRRIHLYLGLASGLFLMVVCLTGTILVFEQELEQAWHPQRYFVTAATTPRLPLARLAAAVRAHQPKAKISSFKIYTDPARTVEVSLAGGGGPGRAKGEQGGGPRREGRDKAGEGRSESSGSAEARGPMGGSGGKGGPGGRGGKGGDNGPRMFVNPYTAAVVGELNPRENFFHFIEEIHRGLVAGRVGKLVMGINSIIFLFILGTGIVLWWPAARKALTARLRVKWGSGWKRLNHDFHTVLGFYASVFLFIMAATGVGMSFDWVGKTINILTHSPQQRSEAPTSAPAAAGTAPFGADAALALARQQAPAAESYLVQLPKEATGSIRVATLRPGTLTERATDDVYLDQYSGRVLRQTAYAQQPVGQRIRGLFKPVHTGAIFGWPTKVLALIIVLLGVTFPITGTIMWWNRTSKGRRKVPPRVAVVG